jgi:hypothetical protein
MYDWRGFSSLPRFDSRSRRRCGNVESRVLCGFPSSEGGRNRCGRKAPPSRPRSVISTARPRFIGHSVENAPFGRPAERKWRLSESRVECTILQILAQSHKIVPRLSAYCPRRRPEKMDKNILTARACLVRNGGSHPAGMSHEEYPVR